MQVISQYLKVVVEILLKKEEKIHPVRKIRAKFADFIAKFIESGSSKVKKEKILKKNAKYNM